MFRSTLTKIKKVCTRAVVTSTCREKTCDGRFNRSPEIRKKAQNKATKFEEQKQKCLNIIDDCFTPLEPYEHKVEHEENRLLMQDTRQIDPAQAEREKCEKILCQCFGAAEHYEITAESGETESYEETVETIHMANEIKQADTPGVQMVDSEVRIQMVRAEPLSEKVQDEIQTSATRSVEGGARIVKAEGALQGDEIQTQTVIQEARADKAEAIQKVMEVQGESKIDSAESKTIQEHEITAEKIAAIQKIDDEFQNEMAKCKEPIQRLEYDIKPEKVAIIQKLDDEYQTEMVKAQGNPGKYLNDSERQQYESDLKAIHVLKDSLLFDDLKSVDKHFNIKRNEGNKNVQPLPGHIQTSNIKNTEIQDNKEQNPAKEDILKDIEQEEQVQYREVLQTADLHYKQLENVELNNIAAQEFEKNITETPVVQKYPEPLSYKEEKIEFHEPENPTLDTDTEPKIFNTLSSKGKSKNIENPERQKINTFSADPPTEYENAQSFGSEKEKVEYHELENLKNKTDITEPYLEPEKIEPLSSKEEKVELYETDKLKMNTTNTTAPTERENTEMSSKEDNEKFRQPQKVNLKLVETETKTEQGISELISKDNHEELEAENVKINIVLATPDTDCNKTKSEMPPEQEIETEASLKPSVHNLIPQIRHEHINISQTKVTENLELNEGVKQSDLQEADEAFKASENVKCGTDATPIWQLNLSNPTITENTQKTNAVTVESQVEQQYSEQLSCEERDKDQINNTEARKINLLNTNTPPIKQINKSTTFKSESENKISLVEEDLSKKTNLNELEYLHLNNYVGENKLNKNSSIGENQQTTLRTGLINNSLQIETRKLKEHININNIDFNNFKGESKEENINPHEELEKSRVMISTGEDKIKDNKTEQKAEFLNINNTDKINFIDEKEAIQANISEPSIVYLRNCVEKKMSDIMNNEKSEQNNYTPQIDIANEMASNKEDIILEPANVGTQMTEQNHYTPQIYLQTLNFEEPNKDHLLDLANPLEPNEQESNISFGREKIKILRFTNTKMTELDHYSPQIYTDAIEEAQKVLKPFKDKEKVLQNKETVVELQKKQHVYGNSHIEPQRIGQLGYQQLEKAVLNFASKRLKHNIEAVELPMKELTIKIHNKEQNIEPQEIEQLDHQEQKKAAPNITSENVNDLKKIRKNNIVFAHIDVSAIDQSLDQMLHAKPKRISKSNGTKCYYKAPTPAERLPTRGDIFDVKVPFDDTVKSLVKLDKDMKLHYIKHEVDNVFKDLRREEENQAAINLNDFNVLKNKYDKLKDKFLHSTRDAGTSLIKELKGNVKERTPTTRLSIDKHGNLYSPRSPSRRHRRTVQRDAADVLKNDDYYDKIAIEWMRNEEKNVSKQFDNIASLHKARYTKDKYASRGGNEELDSYVGRCRMPKIEDDSFLAKTHALSRHKEQHKCCEQPLRPTANIATEQIVGVKPRSSDKIIKDETEDDAIELERKISQMCIGSSETTPFLYNHEKIIMGDMSRGPLCIQTITEKEEQTIHSVPSEQISDLETKTDYNYHKKAIIKLIGSISHLRGFLDEGKEPTQHSLDSYHDSQTKRHAMLYKTMVDTVTKAENMVTKEETAKSPPESESETTFYSAEDMSTHDMDMTKTRNESKNPDLSAKITVASTDLSSKNDPSPNKLPKPNSTNVKNLKLTSTVFNTDINATLNNHSSTGNQRNDLSVDALIQAVRNYSYGSTSKPFEPKTHGDDSKSKGDTNQKESPDIPDVEIQCDFSTQTQRNQCTQQNPYCDRYQTNVVPKAYDVATRDDIKTKDEQEKLNDAFVDIQSAEEEQKDDEQQTILLSVAKYVKTDPEPENAMPLEQNPSVTQRTDQSNANAIQTSRNDMEEQTIPHVEQIYWEPQESEFTHVIKESKPTENIPEQLSQQEKQYNNNLKNYYEKFLNLYEPKYDYARQQYNTYYTSNEASNERQNEASRKEQTGKCSKEAQKVDKIRYDADEIDTQETTQWSAQMCSHHDYTFPNEPQNNYYYNYEQQENNQYYPDNRPDKGKTNEPHNKGHGYGYDHKKNNPYFQFTNTPVYETNTNEKSHNLTVNPLEYQPYPQSNQYYAQGVIPPPSAGYVPSLQMIQKPSMAQALNFEHFDHYNNYNNRPNFNTGPMYTDNNTNMNHQQTQAYNTRQEKLRAIQSFYEYSQQESVKKDQVNEEIPVVLMESTEKYKEPLEQEEKEQEVPVPQKNYDYNYNHYSYYQNPVTNQSGTENEFNSYDNISEKEQYNFNYDNSFEYYPKDENAPKYNSQQSLKQVGSDHEYYDASSHHSIPSNYMQNNQNYYQYYSATPDHALLNEYYKKHGHMRYPPYTASICPLNHQPGDKCEHCCAEDTCRPNELTPEEAEMKSSEAPPKKSNPEVHFAKPRIKKRKSGSRGSGRGALERGIPKELELNTAITLPSLDENLRLSELLDRVRKRNRLLNMVEVLKPYDPIQMVKCDDKDPPNPPEKPKTTVGPGKCPTSSPEPCRIPCPRTNNPCDKPKPKDPCHRYGSSAEKVTLMLYVGKKAKERQRPKVQSPKDSSDDPGGKTKVGVTQMLVTALVKLRKLMEDSDTSLDPSDSEESKKNIDFERGQWRSLKRVEEIAEKFMPRVKRVGKTSPLDHLKEGILQARKHITSGFPVTCQADEVFYDAS